MVNVPFATSDWRRTLSGEPYAKLRNRYYEENPVNQANQVAMLSRPTLKRWLEVGAGPIRSNPYSQLGSFDNALFVLSGEELYRIDTDNTTSMLGAGFFNGNPEGIGSMVATAAIGPGTPEMLYIVDGVTLWLYMQNGYAMGVLTASGAIANGNVVRIDNVYYQWTNGSVDAGAPAGTVGNPWLVNLGAANNEALYAMYLAVNGEGEPGVDYSTALTPHPSVLARSSTTNTLRVQARDVGAPGNTIVTTETGANISWGGGTLAGGGTEFLTTVDMPDDLAPVALAYLNQHVFVVVGEQEGFNGRFFWIEPGETFIRPDNFATNERAPDPTYDVKVIGNQLWFFSPNSTEVWYMTGDPDAPVTPVQGQAFTRGVVQGTAVQIRDSVVLVDNSGTVYVFRGGGAPDVISDPSIAERIRSRLREQLVV